MRVVKGTDIGSGRRINQDYLISDERNGIFIVADGIGGYANGEIASAYASERLHRRMKALRLENFEKDVRQIIYQVNGELVEYCNNSFGGVRMGTTALAVKVFDGAIGYVSVGDTNVYGIKGGIIEQINKSHSFPGKEMRRVISSALGPDCLEQIDSGFIGEYDILVMCTDGLSKCVTPQKLLDIVRNNEFENTAKALIAEALRIDGSDNITVMVIDVRG